MTVKRARWAQRLAFALVEADLSVDAAARLWGLDRSKVLQLLRSDTARRPAHVVDWLDRQISERSGQQEAVDNLPSSPSKPRGA